MTDLIDKRQNKYNNHKDNKHGVMLTFFKSAIWSVNIVILGLASTKHQ